MGEESDRLLVSVHGNLSHKADTVIHLLAQEATRKGYQVLSFDLPERGDRKGEATPCKLQTCVEELRTVMNYAKTKARNISLFGCSMGAYFSLLADPNAALEQALFLSPVVDMERIIENMMTWFSVSEERLKEEREMETPIGQTLYWDDDCFVKEHPIVSWEVSTELLYGTADHLCEEDKVLAFAERFGCHMTSFEQGAFLLYRGTIGLL